jgi:hypothetical protein
MKMHPKMKRPIIFERKFLKRLGSSQRREFFIWMQKIIGDQPEIMGLAVQILKFFMTEPKTDSVV